MVMAKQLVHFLHPGPHPRTGHPQHSHQILTLSFSQARVPPPTPAVHYDPMPRWLNLSLKVLSEHFPLCFRGTKCTPPFPSEEESVGNPQFSSLQRNPPFQSLVFSFFAEPRSVLSPLALEHAPTFHILIYMFSNCCTPKNAYHLFRHHAFCSLLGVYMSSDLAPWWLVGTQ